MADCSICLLTSKAPAFCIPCGHVFCNACINRWRQSGQGHQSNSCPQCRVLILDTKKIIFDTTPKTGVRKMYVLVEFLDTNEIDVVPDNWLIDSKSCYWPNRRASSKLTSLVMQKVMPEETWDKYPIKELYRCASYDTIRLKLKKAETFSNLTSTADSESEEEDCRRSKRKRTVRIISSDEEISQPPSPKPSTSKEVPVSFVSIPRPPARMQSSNKGLSFTSSINSPERPNEVPRSSFQRALPTSSSFNDSSQKARDLRMFTLLEKIRTEQESMKNMLQIMMSKFKQGGKVNLPEDVCLPVKCVEDMESIETKLEDESIFNSVVDFLSIIGGKNRRDCTRRVLKEIMTNNLAKKYSWFGKKGNLAFGKLKIARILHNAVQENFKCTIGDIEKDSMAWFHSAGDRDGGRKEREKVAVPNESFSAEDPWDDANLPMIMQSLENILHKMWLYHKLKSWQARALSIGGVRLFCSTCTNAYQGISQFAAEIQNAPDNQTRKHMLVTKCEEKYHNFKQKILHHQKIEKLRTSWNNATDDKRFLVILAAMVILLFLYVDARQEEGFLQSVIYPVVYTSCVVAKEILSCLAYIVLRPVYCLLLCIWEVVFTCVEIILNTISSVIVILMHVLCLPLMVIVGLFQFLIQTASWILSTLVPMAALAVIVCHICGVDVKAGLQRFYASFLLHAMAFLVYLEIMALIERIARPDARAGTPPAVNLETANENEDNS